MRIIVTQEHVDAGEVGSPWHCPVALALKEQVGGRFSVCTHYTRVADHHYYDHSQRLSQFIQWFDSGQKGTAPATLPATFILRKQGIPVLVHGRLPGDGVT